MMPGGGSCDYLTELESNQDTQIFVFGSNQAGRHGAGAALEAKKNHGAIYGKSSGRQGMSYAIPTKDVSLSTLSVPKIAEGVKQFITYANDNPELTFMVTAIGCGLAGYDPKDIAPLFKNVPFNVNLPQEFKDVLNDR